MESEILAALKKRLLDIQEEMTGKVASLQRDSLSQSPREQSGDLSGYSIHQADTASDSYDREIALSIASREQELLNDVETALAKMQAGDYGTCELCSSPIDETRLQALPYARLCRQCKEHQENSRSSA